MAVLCFLHAHPDDESITTGGTIARAAAEGHTVVLVMATGGEHGQTPSDLGAGETLADRRRKETEESCNVLGIQHLEWLGYHDSGMTGWHQNDQATALLQAPLEEASVRLANILSKYGATVLFTYDWHGNYGHPDHIMVNKVGYRAAEIAGVTEIFEATMNRDAFRRMQAVAREAGLIAEEDGFNPDGPADDGNPMGLPEAELTHQIDVMAYMEQKRASIFKHKSQIADDGFITKMPLEAFTAAFRTEWFRKAGAPTEPKKSWII